MELFVTISIAALFFYTFLLLTLFVTEQNRSINAYLLALGAMLFWTGGSLFTRMGVFPSPKLWSNLSLLGVLAFVFAYLLLGRSLEAESGGQGRTLLLWGLTFAAAWTLNLHTGCFLGAPLAVTRGESVIYIHTLGVGAPVLIFLFLGALVQMALPLIAHAWGERKARRALLPFGLGLLLPVMGLLPFLLPAYRAEGIPFGAVSGMLGALCVLYGLYRRRLFRLTIFVSRGSCSALAGVCTILLFSRFAQPIHRLLEEEFSVEGDQCQLVLSLLVTLTALGIYRLLAMCVDYVFVREEVARAARLRQFSEKVSRSLELEEVFDCIAELIWATLRPSGLLILVSDAQSGDFLPLCGEALPEDEAPFLPGGHPLVQWLEGRQDCLPLAEIRRSEAYLELSQEERAILERLETECVLGLKEGEKLVGLILLAGKQSRSGSYHSRDISFLDAIGSISAIAVANARLYAEACLEARSDELTGLYNRKYFYELFDEEIAQAEEDSLALCLFSLDELKLYNQLYGYKEGDMAIADVGRIIAKAVGGDGIVARHSGKVFAVLLPGYTLYEAKSLAEGIRVQVCRMNSAREDCALRALTVSAGIAAMPASEASTKELFERADLALFHVKHNGKNAVLAYTNGDYAMHKAKVSVTEQRTAYNEHESTIFALMAAIDAKDHYTFNHSMNVLYYATKLAQRLDMSAEYIEIIREAALLHDIGKIGIPETILNKLGALSMEEYDLMKGHVEQSITMIKFLPSLDYVIPTVVGHHERYDGHGYPRGLKGEEIPLGARILCIADSFDAMMSKRSYKEAYSLERTISILEEEAGRQFDPQLVYLFVHLLREGEIELRGVPVS